MTKARGEMAKINPEAIRDKARVADWTLSEASSVLGYSGSWLNKCTSRGDMQLTDVERLAGLFRCSAADLLMIEPEPEPEPTPARTEATKAEPANVVMLANIQNAADDIRAELREIRSEIDELKSGTKFIYDVYEVLFDIREILNKKPQDPVKFEKPKSDPERMLDLLEEKLNLGVGGRNIRKKEFVSACMKANINTANMDRILKNAGYSLDKSGGVQWIMDERGA